MIHSDASLDYLLLHQEIKYQPEQSLLPASVEGMAGRSLQTKPLIQDDKQSLKHLLEQAAARVPVIDLDENEEILRLIPILCAYFSRTELLQLVGEPLTARMLDLNRLEAAQNLILEQELQHILRAFNQESIAIMLFKGPALAYTVYPEPTLRTYHDIDLLIQPGDLSRVHELLLQMGFTFYEEYRANATNSKRTGFNYVLARSDSWLEIPVELHTAPHPSEIGTDFEVEALWRRATQIEILGELTLTMHPIDNLLYLCWHYRFHSFTRLLWLYDLVALLRAEGPELDWIELVQAARSQYLATTLYYCLSWCRDIFGVAIPTEVFGLLRPPLASRLVIEHVAMPNTVATLVSSQGQARRIIAHRAMVDSTGALLKAGIQALFPSPAAMGRRYMDNSRLPQKYYFFYYIIHPWTTVAKGFRYLLKREKR